MDVVSAIGLAFAAVAAWGAVTTVRLTQYMIRDADLRKLIDGVVAMKHAAAALEELGPNWARLELDDRFRDAQSQLDRAFVVPPATSSPEADPIIERLLNAHPRHSPEKTRQDAARAELLLSSRRPPPRMPGWYIRVITLRARRRARRLDRDRPEKGTEKV